MKNRKTKHKIKQFIIETLSITLVALIYDAMFIYTLIK